MIIPDPFKPWVAAGALFTFCACASSGGKKFDDITPGMPSKDVRSAMNEGPTRFEKIGETGYSSWYWGDQYCVLFKDDRVAGKDASSEGRSGNAKGVEYKENHKAQCLAPGQTANSGTSRSVNIPGVGTVHLPGSG